ncbi:MAG: hypothetical protein AAFV25_04720 [Bacteroidota bacterium]
MRKMMVPLVAIALIAWILGGSWWYGQVWVPNRMPNNFVGEQSPQTPIRISHSLFPTMLDEVFAFPRSEARFEADSLTKSCLRTMANRLTDGAELLLQGVYLEAEAAPDENLGLQRAAFVRDLLVQQGVQPNKIRIEGQKVAQLLQRDEELLNAVRFEFRPVERASKALEVQWVDLMRPLNLYFPEKQYSIELNSQLESYCQQLQTQLKQDQEAKVHVTGYSTRRKAASDSRKRATAVYQLLRQQGIDKDRLLVQYEKTTAASKGSPVLDQDNRRVEVRILKPAR